MSKSVYDEKMYQLIDECDYKEIKRSPLPKIKKECDTLRQSIKKVFGYRYGRSLIVSNPIVAKMYGLPKLHKQPLKMRRIVSSINTPSYKIAKWLVNEIKTLPPFKGFSIKIGRKM